MLFSKLWRQRQDDSNFEHPGALPVRRIDYIKLEERRVLNASFAFDLMTADLTLSNFTNDAFAEDRIDIEQVGGDYVFTLNDGFWMGTDSAQVGGNGTNVLVANSDFVDLINIIGNTNDSFEIHFGQFSHDGDLGIATLGGFAEFGSITQDPGTELVISADFLVDGAATIDLQNVGNDFELVSINNVDSARLSDINRVALDGARVDSILSVSATELSVTDQISGNQIRLDSADGLTQSGTGRIVAGQLVLVGGGIFDLDAFSNNINQLAVDVDGDLQLDNGATIQFSTLEIDSMQVDGVKISGDFELTTASAGGDVVQTAKIVVAGATLIDAGTGHVCLEDGDADGDGQTDNNLYRVSFVADNVSLVDRNGVILLNSTVADRLWVAAGDTDDDLSDNFGGRIDLDGKIDVGHAILFQASSGVKQTSGYLQTQELLLGGDEPEQASGNFVLDADNLVSHLAANLLSDLSFTNQIDLNLANLNFTVDCGPELVISGIRVAGDLVIEVGGDVTQSAAVVVAGNTAVNATGDVCLTNPLNDFVGQVQASGNSVQLVDVNDLDTGAITASQQIYLRSGAGVEGRLTLGADLTAQATGGQVLLQSSDGVQQNSGSISADELLLGGNRPEESSGTFALAGANEINTFAFAVGGDVHFNAITTYEIAAATFASVCDPAIVEVITAAESNQKVVLASGQSIQLAAPVTAPTLVLQASSGVTQADSAAVIAEQLVLTGAGVFDLVAAANEIDQLAALIDGDLVFSESDGFSIATIQCGEDLFNGIEVGGDVAVMTAGNLDQQPTAPIIVGGNTVLDTAGVGNICLMGADVDADGRNDNDVQSLQIISAANAEFADADDLQMAGVAVAGQVKLVAGDSNVDSTEIGNGVLLLNGDLIAGTAALLQASAGVLQVDGSIVVPELLLGGDQTAEGTGDFDLQLANEVDKLAANINGRLWFSGVTSLAISELNFASVCDGTAESINGASTAGNDAVLNVEGSVVIDATLNVGPATAFLNVTADVSQSSAGIVTAGSAGWNVGGNVVLHADNLIDALAGDVGGTVLIHNGADLIVDQVVTGPDSEYSATGLNSAGDAKLLIDGNLDIDESVSAPTANVLLVASGNLNQALDGTIHADGLGLMVEGATVLGSDNTANILAADNVGFTLIHVDSNLVVDTVVVDEMAVTGLTTQDADAKLIVAGDLTLQSAVDAGSANLFVNIGGDFQQTVSGTIIANGVGMMVSGHSLLTSANDVDFIAAENLGFFHFNDIDELVVGLVTGAAGTPFEMSATGIVTADGDVKLQTAGGLTLVQQIATADANTFLSVGGDLAQTDDGTITTNGLGLMVGGSTVLQLENDAVVLAANTDGSLIFDDNADDLTIGVVSVFDDTEFQMQAVGVVTTDDSVKISVHGNLLIQQPVELGDGVFFVLATGDVSQSAEGTITAAQLGMMVSGDVRLDAANDVNEFAVNNLGLTLLNDIDDLAVSSVTFEPGTAVEMSATGLLHAPDGNIKLIVADDLTIVQSVVAQSGTLLVDVGGNLSQTAGGILDVTWFGMMVDGNTQLSAGNQVVILASDNAGNTVFRSTVDVTIGQVELESMTVTGLLVDAGLNLQILGDLNQTEAIVVGGNSLLQADGKICLTGNQSGPANNNDFIGTLTAVASTAVEVEDSNSLTVIDVTAGQQIRLRSGDGDSGPLLLLGKLQTTMADGRVLLQSDSGVFQDASGGLIITDGLMLGSVVEDDARLGNFVLDGANLVANLAGHLVDSLALTNEGDLNIAPLQFVSLCDGLLEDFSGVDLGGLTFNIDGNLTDAVDAQSIIQTSASLIVSENIEWGDGDARLEFAGQTIGNLLEQNVSANRVTIGAVDNPVENVSLYVDSTIILADVYVSDLLYINTIEAVSVSPSAGDILQTMLSDSEPSQIWSTDAAFLSRASVQLTDTYFDRLALQSNSVSQLIAPFVINAAIGSTFTGSIDSNIFANQLAANLLLGGDDSMPVDGVLNVGTELVDSQIFNPRFVADNNQFVNPFRVGAIAVNGRELDLVSFDSLGLTDFQLQDAINPAGAATSLGDIYVETRDGHDLNVLADVDTLSRTSNTTIVAGGELTLGTGAEFKRISSGQVVGLVNRLQVDFSLDGFIMVNPRSVIDAPGDLAFSDLNAQLDSAIGFQDFEFFFGNPGERSFNLIVGWFVDFVTPSQALDAAFQRTLVQQMFDTTNDFLLSDFSNFGQGVSAYTLDLDSRLPASFQPLALTNAEQFASLFFGDRSYLLSQIFLTNDAKINLFESSGTTDLNFTQEVIPSRTVVENPDPIVVATPKFEIPESVGSLPQPAYTFVNLIQDPESPPITTDQQPESYFLIRYTADDDGVFEESFKWDDANDDPDAIRAAIEGAELVEGDEDDWPETSGDDEGGWFEKIKYGQQVKPGLYFIFEVQEGQLIPDPVDAPVDRTDIENLVEPDHSPAADITTFQHGHDPLQPSIDGPAALSHGSMSSPVDAGQDRFPDHGHVRFSGTTRIAMLGSCLILAQNIMNRQTTDSAEINDSVGTNLDSRPSIFSRASRLLRRQYRNPS